MRTILFGASDDLIEIEGAICDETDATHNGKSKIVASDGTTATIEYAPGHDAVWSIIVTKKGTLYDRVIRGDEESETTNHMDVDVVAVHKEVPSYSDVLIFKPGLEWIKVNSQKFKPHGKR